MNNETQPTPGQLAQWREEAEAVYVDDDNINSFDIAEDHYVAGYLRAKQENEQALKDARKQAIEETLAVLHQTYKSTADELAAINELLA